jgi:hypothetical protein
MLEEIIEAVERDGTVVQEEGFPQVPVHHLTHDDYSIEGDVIRYIGTDGVYGETGWKYPYIDMDANGVSKVKEYIF